MALAKEKRRRASRGRLLGTPRDPKFMGLLGGVNFDCEGRVRRPWYEAELCAFRLGV